MVLFWSSAASVTGRNHASPWIFDPLREEIAGFGNWAGCMAMDSFQLSSPLVWYFPMLLIDAFWPISHLVRAYCPLSLEEVSRVLRSNRV